MYRVLVVDDEKYIADATSALFEDYEKEKFEVYTAYISKKAIEIADKNKIDILITDINMPSMNGLELIDRICEKWPHCKCIILTVYNDSEYMHRALRQNIVDYVLKAEGDDHLIKAINKAVTKLNNEFDVELILQKSKNDSEKLNEILKDRLFESILDGETDRKTGMELFKQTASFGVDLTKDFIVILSNIICTDCSYSDFVLNKEKIREDAKLYMETVSSVEALMFHKNKAVFILQANERYKDLYTIYEYLKDMIPEIQESFKKNYGVSLSFVCYKKWILAEALPDCVIKLEKIVNSRIFVDEETVLEVENTEKFGHYDDIVSGLTEQDIIKLNFFLQNNKFDEFKEFIFAIIEGIDPSLVNEIIPVISYHISMIFLSFMKSKYMNEEAKRIKFYAAINKVMTSAKTHELKSAIENVIVSYSIRRDEDIHTEYEKILDKIFTFVNANIEGDTSLSRLAEVVHFNPYYLSKLFKKKYGSTISDYVMTVKLNKAKEMLIDGNFKVNDITKSLGFTSREYFTRFFKKFTGETPSEYRKNYLESK